MNGEPLQLDELQTKMGEEEATWEAVSTELFLLSLDEKRLRLGYVPGPEEPTLESREKIAVANLSAFESDFGIRADYTAPASFDWRNVNGKNYITGVKDQGGCGSCVAFGTSAAVEGTLRVRLSDPGYNIDVSEAHLFYCHARAQGRRCSNGWWVPPALDSFKNPGVAHETCYPYTVGDQDCSGLCSNWTTQVTQVKNWHSIKSIADMKSWISTQGPLVACFTVYEDFFAYRSGIYKYISGKVSGGHCICCVGYNDAGGYWIMKNSWGSGWGEAGYFRIAYGQCGIDAEMWAVDDFTSEFWQNNKRVAGLWTINEDRNAWVFIAGIGWKKVANDNDNIFFNMLTQLITAKAGSRPINYLEQGNTIKELYVL